MLDVHIFGAKSSPTVSTFVLQHHGETMKGEISPEVAHAIVKQFYIDDYLDLHADVETARRIRIELTDVLKKGRFELCKWNSNDDAALETETCQRADEKSFDDAQTSAMGKEDVSSMDRILGVQYSFKSDEFLFYVKPEKVSGEIRIRRQLLSVGVVFRSYGISKPLYAQMEIAVSKSYPRKRERVGR